MARSTRRQALIRAARDGQPVQRVEIPRTTCPRCGQDRIPALPDGAPRPHLRPTRPGEAAHSPIVPTMAACEAVAEDLLNSPYRMTLDELPSDAADAFAWLVYRDELRDQGVPENEIPSFQDWKAARHG